MKHYLFSALKFSAAVALISYAGTKTSLAQNNNVQIDMNVMQALNNYYNDEQQQYNENTQVIKQEDIIPEQKAALPALPIDHKTKKIKQLLKFEQKELAQAKTAPVPLKKPVELAAKANPMHVSGQTRKTEKVLAKVDIQRHLPKDDSGIKMPAVPAASIAAEAIEPSAGAVNEPELQEFPSAANSEAEEKLHLETKSEFIDITANSSSQNTNTSSELAALQDMGPQVLTPTDIAANPENSVTLPYKVGQDSISGEHELLIEAEILTRLQNNQDVRLQIVSYASSTQPNLSNARRISLARALAIRTYLIDNGIQANRMDVRALGNETDSDLKDRIDMVFLPLTSRS